jgi:hypothetical protein
VVPIGLLGFVEYKDNVFIDEAGRVYSIIAGFFACLNEMSRRVANSVPAMDENNRLPTFAIILKY